MRKLDPKSRCFLPSPLLVTEQVRSHIQGSILILIYLALPQSDAQRTMLGKGHWTRGPEIWVLLQVLPQKQLKTLGKCTALCCGLSFLGC